MRTRAYTCVLSGRFMGKRGLQACGASDGDDAKAIGTVGDGGCYECADILVQMWSARQVS